MGALQKTKMKGAYTIAVKAREPTRILILMVKDAKIKVTKDGPYLVTCGIPLLRMIIELDSYGDPCVRRVVQRYPQRESYALCRCGESRNKPYCDDSHVMQRFNGTETASNEFYLENVKEYLGPELKLTDKPELCSGAGFCVRDAGIWNLTVRSDRPGFKESCIADGSTIPASSSTAIALPLFVHYKTILGFHASCSPKE
jgi:CDGSH-type Zn-finger protein